jgi:hypothetical protein
MEKNLLAKVARLSHADATKLLSRKLVLKKTAVLTADSWQHSKVALGNRCLIDHFLQAPIFQDTLKFMAVSTEMKAVFDFLVLSASPSQNDTLEEICGHVLGDVWGVISRRFSQAPKSSIERALLTAYVSFYKSKTKADLESKLTGTAGSSYRFLFRILRSSAYELLRANPIKTQLPRSIKESVSLIGEPRRFASSLTMYKQKTSIPKWKISTTISSNLVLT